MKNILSKFKINSYTYLFIILCLICGFIKNISIIFFICLFHELGHIFFIKMFKYGVISVEILPFGGFTTIDKPLNSSINKDLVIALGGFLFQIILFIILILLKNYFNPITYKLFFNYNLILLLFNLIPIIPLDGSKVVNLLLEKIFSYHFSYHLNIYLSLIFLMIFLFINYIYHLDNYFIITFLFYKIILAWKNYKYYSKRFLLERYLYDLDYNKIDNHTKSLKDLKKNTLHFFKEDKHYVKEKTKLKQYFHER